MSWSGIDGELVASRAMHKALVRFDPAKGSFPALLNWILLCEKISAYRHAMRLNEVALPDDFHPTDDSFAREGFCREWEEELTWALNQLLPADREVLKLRFYDDLSYEEIFQGR